MVEPAETAAAARRWTLRRRRMQQRAVLAGRPPSAGAERRGLCYAHYFQWFRAGQPADFTAWATFEAQPVGAPRAATFGPDRRLRRLPQIAADEIRFVVATKVRCGDWDPNTSLRRF